MNSDRTGRQYALCTGGPCREIRQGVRKTSRPRSSLYMRCVSRIDAIDLSFQVSIGHSAASRPGVLEVFSL
eukprot:scaffold128525_cov35-Prasinocladus_malaysianus.AAC.1